MKKKLEQNEPEDGDLFQQAMEGVIPIAPVNRLPPAPPVHRNHHAESMLSRSPAIDDSWSDHGILESAPTSYLRNGISTMTLRKLRRGQWRLQDNIDLHGCNSDEARRLLSAFLQHALDQEMRCVNVIHGKGWRAEGGEGILKIRVRHWLTQHPLVLAFCEAPPNAGGGGAVWVLLKTAA